MRSIQFLGPKNAVLTTASMPEARANEALVRADLTGISAGTERMWFSGTASALKSGRRGYPYTPGYAFVGTVIAVGAEFEGLSAGDRVFATKPHASHAFLKQDDYWFKLPAFLSDEDALATALTATCIHAIHRSEVMIGDAVAVAGLGTLGLLMLQVLSATVCGPVVALTRGTAKLELALSNGASHALTYEEFAVRRKTLPHIQSVFECSGVSDNVARVSSIPRSQGNVVLTGFYNDPISVDGEAVFSNELKLIGVRGTGSNEEASEFNRWSRRRNITFAFDLVSSGRVRAKELVSHEFPATDFAKAFELIESTDPYLLVCLRWGIS